MIDRTAKLKQLREEIDRLENEQQNSQSDTSKTEQIRELMRRPEGVTREEVLQLTGWPSFRAFNIVESLKGKETCFVTEGHYLLRDPVTGMNHSYYNCIAQIDRSEVLRTKTDHPKKLWKIKDQESKTWSDNQGRHWPDPTGLDHIFPKTSLGRDEMREFIRHFMNIYTAS